jgi:hypothetical protein
LDLLNAFNSISRNAIWQGIIEYCPSLGKYFLWAYGRPTRLFYSDGTHVTMSERGVRQGDPLGMLLFSIGFHSVLRTLRSRFPNLEVLAYADDVNIYTTVNDAAAVITTFEDLCKDIGLTVNKAAGKSAIFTAFANEFDAANIGVVRDGLEILGCPAGTHNYVQDHLEHRFRDLKLATTVVTKLGGLLAFPSIRHCLNTNGSYLSRVCPPWLLNDQASDFNDWIATCIGKLIAAPRLPDYSRVFISLPENMGGLGIVGMTSVSRKTMRPSILRLLDEL